MTDDRRDERPDYSALLRSPYDEPERPSEGESDIPWVPAVVAACLGALAAGAFVVFAVATGPTEPSDDALGSTSTTTVTSAPVPAEGPPEGFIRLTDDVAGAVVGVEVSSRGAVLTVATAVPGSADPAKVAPVDVAYWELRNGGATVAMVGQSIGKLGLGNVAVTFPPQLSFRDPEIVANVATSTAEEVTVIGRDATYPQVVEPFEVQVGEVTIAITELTFGDSWGWVAWSATGGVARVDPTITFLGTDDPGADGINPTLLVPLSRQPFAFSTPSRPLPTPFGFSGSESLVRSGEPIAGDNQATGVEIELLITVPTSVEAVTPLPLP